jgi:hypothetical protein
MKREDIGKVSPALDIGLRLAEAARELGREHKTLHRLGVRITRSVEWSKLFKSAIDFPDNKILYWKEMRKRDPNIGLDTMRYLRPAMMQCQVIELSNDIVSVVTKLSTEINPRTLLEHMVNVEMPFEHTLFTWDAFAMHAAYRTYTPADDQFSPEEEDTPACMVSTYPGGFRTFTDFVVTNKQICFAPVTYSIDPLLQALRGHPFELFMIKDKDKNYTPHSQFWWTNSKLDEHPGFDKEFDADPRFGSRPMFPTGFRILADAYAAHERGQKGAITNGVLQMLRPTAAMPGWFATLCALMNMKGSTRVVNELASPASGTATHKPSKASKDRKAVHHLTTFLPREEVIRKVRGHLTYDRKKPGEHTVPISWRTLPKWGDPKCAHVWPKQFTQRQECELCGAKRVRVAEHNRGAGPMLSKTQRRFDYGGMSIKKLAKAIEKQPEGQ